MVEQTYKIAIVNELFPAGADRCAKDLIQHLPQHYQTKYYPTSVSQTDQELLDSLEEFAPDLVHLHSFDGHFSYSVLNRISEKYNSCFTLHNPRSIGFSYVECWECNQYKTCLSCPKNSILESLFPFLTKHFRSRAGKYFTHLKSNNKLALISPSSWMDRKIKSSELKKFAAKSIYYGIDTDHFTYQLEAKEKLNLTEKKQILFFVAYSGNDSMMHPRKGLNYLSEAFLEELSVKYKDLHLLIAGGGKIPEHPQISSLGMLSYEELPMYYSAADIVVVPSLADNLPYVILEAMSCSKPIVATIVGGISDAVLDGETGKTVEAKNSKDLAQKIDELLSAPELIEEFGLRARRKVKLEFGMERFIEEHDALYQSLISNKDG